MTTTSPATVRVAALQMVSGTDLPCNLAVAESLIARAVDSGAQLLVLPETFALFLASEQRTLGIEEAGDQPRVRGFLAAQASKHGVWLVGGTLPIVDARDPRPRAACLVYDSSGAEVARYDKLHLFDVEVADSRGRYRESDDYVHGTRVVVADTPVGRIGLSVCYDLRFPELYTALRAAGAELISAPAAFTAVTGAAHWQVLVRARAIETQCYLLAANQGGSHPGGRETFGHSAIIDPWGRVLAEQPQGEAVLLAQRDSAGQSVIRQNMPLASQRRFASPGEPLPAVPNFPPDLEQP